MHCNKQFIVEILSQMYNYDQMTNYKDKDMNLFNTYKDDRIYQKEMTVYKFNDILAEQIKTRTNTPLPSSVAEGVDASTY